jgi:hypothetical protein
MGCEYLLKAEYRERRERCGFALPVEAGVRLLIASEYHVKFEYDALMIAIVLAKGARVSNGECGLRGLRDIRTMTLAA